MYSREWATFFGGAERELRTASFEYAERIARVPDAQVPRHTHDVAHLVFVVRGTYVTEARNQQGACGAGTLIFNPAGTTHRDRFRTDLGRFFAISLANDVSQRIESIHPAAASLRGPQLTTLIERARSELRQQTIFSDLILEGLGLELAGTLARELAHPDRRAPRWLERARDAIHDRCTEHLEIRDLAGEARVHPIHLARAFRQYFDCSPGEYLRRCRIERVRHLLLTTETPLAEVALESGFTDQSQLTHAFRRATGTTPAAFRRDKNASHAQDATHKTSR
jgi:AraC family transcriptional regulator